MGIYITCFGSGSEAPFCARMGGSPCASAQGLGQAQRFRMYEGISARSDRASGERRLQRSK